MPCYNLEEMKGKIHEIKKENFDALLIHQLTNDVEKICQSQKSDNDKKMALISLAEKYVIIIKRLQREYPHLQIFISMVMKRFDQFDQLEMSNGTNIINDNIYQNLIREKSVTLISNNFLRAMDFVKEGRKKFHLSSAGFDKICNMWKNEIENKFT